MFSPCLFVIWLIIRDSPRRSFPTFAPKMTLAQVIGSIITQLGSGVPLWKISVPASIHTDKSALEYPRDAHFSNKKCLDRYNMVAEEQDPIARLGLVTSAFFNIHNPIGTDKPFNPVLGEHIIEEAGDYKIEIEQIRHHPPARYAKLIVHTVLGARNSLSKLQKALNSMDQNSNWTH